MLPHALPRHINQTGGEYIHVEPGASEEVLQADSPRSYAIVDRAIVGVFFEALKSFNVEFLNQADDS